MGISFKPTVQNALEGQLSADPSGLDSDGWKRMLCSKQFGKKTDDLCEAIAFLGCRVCTVYLIC